MPNHPSLTIKARPIKARPVKPRRQRNWPGHRWTRGLAVIGHRGAAGLVAENTLPSFRRAAELDCSAVELDVYVVDGELLVIHDDTLNRTTNGRGQVMRHSLSALRALDAGQKNAEGAQIPLLSEVFATLPTKVAVNIELKGAGTALPVAQALRDWQLQHKILVSSFDHQQLHDFRAQDAATAVAPLFHQPNAEMFDVAMALNACAINLNSRIATPARLRAIRAAGFGALVYTVNSARSARRLIKDGATGVFTDRPDRIRAADLLEN